MDDCDWMNQYYYEGRLSSHPAMPRQAHLEAVLHIMDYLKLKHNSRLKFKPSYPVCTDVYEGAVEAI